MDVLELLGNGMSRANTDFVAGIALKDPALLLQLWNIFLLNEEPTSRKAAWVLDHLTEDHPELILDHLPGLIDMLPEFMHDGLKRHALHIISRYPVMESKKDLLLNLCFDFLVSRKETAAVKAYSMEILYRICLLEPEIKNELIGTLEFAMEETTPGVKSFGKKILKKLSTIQ